MGHHSHLLLSRVIRGGSGTRRINNSQEIGGLYCIRQQRKLIELESGYLFQPVAMESFTISATTSVCLGQHTADISGDNSRRHFLFHLLSASISAFCHRFTTALSIRWQDFTFQLKTFYTRSNHFVIPQDHMLRSVQKLLELCSQPCLAG